MMLLMAFYTHLLTQSVDIEPLDSLDTDGSPVFGSLTTGVNARVERSIQIVGGDGGAVRVWTTRVWLDQEVGEGDRIHLPSGDVLEVQQTESIPTVDGRVEIYRAKG